MGSSLAAACSLCFVGRVDSRHPFSLPPWILYPSLLTAAAARFHIYLFIVCRFYGHYAHPIRSLSASSALVCFFLGHIGIAVASRCMVYWALCRALLARLEALLQNDFIKVQYFYVELCETSGYYLMDWIMEFKGDLECSAFRRHLSKYDLRYDINICCIVIRK